MINYSECKKVVDEIRLNGKHLDVLKNSGFDINNIVKVDYSRTDVEADTYFIQTKNTIKHVGIYNNKIEFCY